MRLRCPAPRPRLTPACAGKTLRGPSWPAALRAHPRVCGENEVDLFTVAGPSGSPPRVRGKPHAPTAPTPMAGLTPACAGKTGPFQSLRRGVAAHPRVCGENPRGRRAPVVESRLTPACAGKTRDGGAPDRISGAHPRVCGENAQVYNQVLPQGGSPPRVRGKLAGFSEQEVARRLTPACAGKTTAQSAPFPSGSGSPPRVRGKHGHSDGRQQHRRLTPACAGKTSLGAVRLGGRGAHPRVCGENHIGWGPMRGHEGSPPRVRGKQRQRLGRPALPRLTPACAGKTGSAGYANAFPRAHPRVCGENSCDGLILNRATGSPPRVRGKRHQRHLGGVLRGLTPACAGKTVLGC